MADPLRAENRIDDFQARDLIDVNAMGAVGGAFAIALEDAALDQDRAAFDRASEDAVLVVVETRIAHREVLALGADAGAVLIGHPRTRERDVFHGDVIPGDHPDRLAGARPIAHVRRALGRLQDEAARPPDRAVDVLARVEAHDVTVLRHRGRLARHLQAAVRSDQEDLRGNTRRACRETAERDE